MKAMVVGITSEMSFSCDEALSEDCVIKVELFPGLERHILPFLLENVPLIPQ